jgi:hypothetical protein
VLFFEKAKKGTRLCRPLRDACLYEPHHYAQPNELDPQKHTLSLIPLAPVNGVQHSQALWDLRYAVEFYGNIPSEFPPQQ